jgi:hypothetical protein
MSDTETLYTSETSPAAAAGRESAIAPSAATGRRKEAIARVRLVPGTGVWTVNGQTLEGIVEALAPDILQLHGHEPPARVSGIKRKFGREVGVGQPADAVGAENSTQETHLTSSAGACTAVEPIVAGAGRAIRMCRSRMQA